MRLIRLALALIAVFVMTSLCGGAAPPPDARSEVAIKIVPPIDGSAKPAIVDAIQALRAKLVAAGFQAQVTVVRSPAPS